MNLLLLPLWALLAVDTPTPESLSDTVALYRNLEFAAYGDEKLQLDLYVPRNITEPVPCIVVIPGGGFRPQVKEKFGDTARQFAEAGFAAAGRTIPFPRRFTTRKRRCDFCAPKRACTRLTRRVSAPLDNRREGTSQECWPYPMNRPWRATGETRVCPAECRQR